MMNKIFILLLILTLAGGALLFWLLRTMPPNMASDPHAEKKESLVVAKPEGVEVHGGSSEEKKEGAENKEAGGEKIESKDSRESPVLKIETEPVKAVVFVDGEMKGQTPLELPLSSKEQQVKLEAPGFKDVSREAPAIKPDMDLDTLTWKIVMRAQPGSLKVSPRALEADEDLALNPKKGKKKSVKIGKAEPKTLAKAEKPAPTPAPAHETEIPTPKTDLKAEAKPSAKSTEPPVPDDNDKAAASENPSNILFLSGRSGPNWIQIQAIPSAQKSSAENNIREYRKALNLNVMGCEVSVKGKGKWVRVLTGPFDSKTEASRMLGTINSRLRDPAFVTGAQECL